MKRLALFLFIVCVAGCLRDEKFHGLENVSFCNLDENNRFKICPSVRTLTEFSSGGKVLIYICDEKTAYIETFNLSIESKSFVDKKINNYRDGGLSAVEICKTKNGVVFKLSVVESNG